MKKTLFLNWATSIKMHSRYSKFACIVNLFILAQAVVGIPIGETSHNEILPVTCSRELVKVDPKGLDCSEVIPREVLPAFMPGERTIHRTWNKGRWLQVNGYACIKVKITSVCYENVFGITDTYTKQEVMLATVDECSAHIRRYTQTSWTPNLEIRYDCHWMQTQTLEKSILQINPISIKFDMLKSVYVFPGDDNLVCQRPPCLMPDLHSLWFPFADHLNECDHLAQTTVSWSALPDEAASFVSHSIHSKTIIGSCRMDLCGFKGFLLESGEWISDSEMPKAVKLHTRRIQDCQNESKMSYNLDSELNSRRSYDQIATQILSHACQQVKLNLQSQEHNFVPSSLQSIAPRREGRHPGYFVINRTLYQTVCDYMPIIKENNQRKLELTALPLGRIVNSTNLKQYQGPTIYVNNVTIGPNGLMWVDNVLTMMDHIWERTLFENIDIDPVYIKLAQAADLKPFDPFSITDHQKPPVTDQSISIKTIISRFPQLKFVGSISMITVGIIVAALLTAKFLFAIIIRKRYAKEPEHIEVEDISLRPVANRLISVSEDDSDFVEFMTKK